MLAALADKSVLTAEPGEGVARYRLPETLREYGQERLQQAGEDTALRRRHRDWHEELARHTDTGWLSPQVADWAARLDREHANVRIAQDFCQHEPGEAEAGLRIAMHIWPYYYWNAGYISEGRYRLGQLLAEVGEPSVWRAQGLLLASFLAAISGDRDAARPLLAEGNGLARQLNDPATHAFAAWARERPACSPVTCTRPSPTTKTGWRPRARPLSMAASAPSCCSPWRSRRAWPVTKSAPSPPTGSLPR